MIDLRRVRGIVPPMVTPLMSDGMRVHEAGVQQLVERLIGQGVHGLFLAGTTGEAWALDDEQWGRLVRFTVEANRGRVPVYAGVSHASTAGAVARARQAEALGADVIVSLAPYYVPPSQADIVRHFQALAKATSLPVLVYQFPGIVKVSISMPTYRALAEIPGVVGVKDSQADVTEFRAMIEALRGNGRDFRMFLGTDTLTDVTVLLGAQGTIPSLSNIAAQFLVEAFECAAAGEWEKSAAAQRKANRLKTLYSLVPSDSVFNGVVGGLKCALTLLGVEVGPPAAPMVAPNAEQTRAIEALLEREGLLG